MKMSGTGIIIYSLAAAKLQQVIIDRFDLDEFGFRPIEEVAAIALQEAAAGLLAEVASRQHDCEGNEEGCE